MGAVIENKELFNNLMTQEEKEIETEALYNKLRVILLLEGIKNNARIKDSEDLINYLNRINLVSYLKLKEGYGYKCLRTTCLSKLTNANFYKYNGIWMYKCFNCLDSKPISQSRLIIEVIQSQHPNLKYLSILNMIMELLSADYENEYYDLVRETINYNLSIIDGLDKNSSLYKLLKRRKLIDFYKEFTEVAKVYALKQQSDTNKIMFYASRDFLKEYWEFVFDKKMNNSILQKIDVLNATGFLRKVGTDELNERMVDRVVEFTTRKRSSAKNKKNYLKQVNCFTIEKMSHEALIEAERVATIILDNKINIITQAHLELFKKPAQLNEDDLKVVTELSNLLETTVSKQGYAIKKEITVEASKEIWDKCLEEKNLMLVKATVRNKEKYIVNPERNLKLDDLLIVRKKKTELDKFIDTARAEIAKELEQKGYVLNRDLYKLICSGKKFYKMEKSKTTFVEKKVLLKTKEKEALIKNNIGKILILDNLVVVKCNKNNVEKYKITDKCKYQETAIVKKD